MLNLIFSCLLMFCLVFAQDTSSADPQTEAVTDALLALLQLTSFVEVNVSFCAERAPDTAMAVKQAADTWYNANNLAMLAQVMNSTPELSANLTPLKAALKDAVMQELVTKATGRVAEWCANVPTLLASPEWNVQLSYAREMQQLRDFVTLVLGAVPLPHQQTLPALEAPSYQQLRAAGINPQNTFIPAEFRCYDEALDDYSHPQLVVQFPVPGQYLSSYGGGRYTLEATASYPSVDWQSGPLFDASSSLSFDEFGQSFYLSRVQLGDGSFDFQCYQQGASEQRALTEFRLKTPQAGKYTCRDAETGAAQVLELQNGTYTVGGVTGTYAVSEIVENGSSSRIDWLTGAFAEDRSYYSEEEGTGFRDFSLSLSEGKAYPGFVYSSSSLALVCEGLGEAVSFAKYGSETAPPAPGTELALNGFFYRLEYSYNSSFIPQFYRFFPDGYVFIGTPEPAGPEYIDCRRTLPNGAPFCATYRVLGNTLYITGTDGNTEDEPFSLAGGIPVLDDEAMTPVTPNTITTFDGLFWANYFNQVGICGAFSLCSSSYLEWNYDLRPDGSFSYSSDSQNLSSMDTALGSSNASAYSNSSNTGTYTVGPYSIELSYANGKVETFFMFVQDAESFVMGDRSFTLKDEQDGD